MIDENEIYEAFRKFVYEKTNWKIVSTPDGTYIGKTFERYLCFKAGYIFAREQA